MTGEEHSLEFLLNFDGRVHRYEQGYFAKFEIKQVEPTDERPHGLRYSFTLHDPRNRRIMGFDNAHTVAAKGKNVKRQKAADHWHFDENDRGRPYKFEDVPTLIFDFFKEIERVLTEHKVSAHVTADEAKPAPATKKQAKAATRAKPKSKLRPKPGSKRKGSRP